MKLAKKSIIYNKSENTVRYIRYNKATRFLVEKGKKEKVKAGLQTTKSNIVNKGKQTITNSTGYRLASVGYHGVKNVSKGISSFAKSENKKELIKNSIINTKDTIKSAAVDKIKNNAVVAKAASLKNEVIRKKNQIGKAVDVAKKATHPVKTLKGAIASKKEKIANAKNKVSGGLRKAASTAKNLSPKNIKNDIKARGGALSASKDYFNKAKAALANKTLGGLGKLSTLANNANFKKISKGINFIIKHWVIALTTTVLVLSAWVVTPIIHATGLMYQESPHYYCDIKPSKDEKKSLWYLIYCTAGNPGGNESVAQAAISMLEPSNLTGYVVDAPPGEWSTYINIHSDVGCVFMPANCIGLTASVVRWSVDDSFPQLCPGDYMRTNWFDGKDYWYEVTDNWDGDLDILEPGDVFLSEWRASNSVYAQENGGESSHTFVYVGSELLHEMYPELPENLNSVAAGWASYLPRAVDARVEAAPDFGSYHVWRYIDDTPRNNKFADLEG